MSIAITTIKKYKWPLLSLIVLVGVFSVFYRMYLKDVGALKDFSAAYSRFDKATSELSGLVLASGPEQSGVLNRFNETSARISALKEDPRADDKRLAMAKEAILLNGDLMGYLTKAEEFENTATAVLLRLKAKASLELSSLIRNDSKLMAVAPQIVDLSAKELENFKAYKRAMASKMDITNQSLQIILYDNGRLNGFNKWQKDNETQIQKQNAELDRLAKRLKGASNRRKAAYAQFRELAGLRD